MMLLISVNSSNNVLEVYEITPNISSGWCFTLSFQVDFVVKPLQ